MKTKTFTFLILFFTASVAAQPSFSIKESCTDQEMNLFSMNDREGGNIGEPGYFKHQVCGTDISDANIRDGCKTGENSVLSMFQRNDSHASTFSDYRWDICVEDIRTTVNESCENSIVSLHSKSDSHVAEPGHFKYQVCHSEMNVEDIKLKMKTSANEVYIGGERADSGTLNTIEVSNPYISTEKGLGIVSYGELASITYTEGSIDVLEMKQTDGSFLIPHTKSYSDIEDDEAKINDRTFLDQNLASFGFSIPDSPEIQVSFSPSHTIEGFDGRVTDGELYTRNLYNSSAVAIKPR